MLDVSAQQVSGATLSDLDTLGTLALYYREPRGPSETDRETVKLVGTTAGLVVESLNARFSRSQTSWLFADRRSAFC